MPKLLDDYLTEAELCEELEIKPRTAKDWRDKRIGPPVTYIKGRPHYRRGGARDWLLSREGKGRAA
jgi:hypothetical protein